MDALECVRATPLRRILAVAVSALAVTHTAAAHAGGAASLPRRAASHSLLAAHSALPAAAPSRVQQSKSQLQIELDDLGGVDITAAVIKGRSRAALRRSILPS
ncbi:hypothetical protein T484DRAFT_1816622 [Baffinella frigidus]|nr:hypothetical protein T484DRAFT_1816622 [Cryptophyta sp. CCMP2293]